MTNAVDGSGAAAVFRTSFPTFAGVQAEFRYFVGSTSSTTTPADGLTFFFVDGDQYQDGRAADAPDGGTGVFAGGLGYAQIPFGFFGIGFDHFGEFSNSGHASGPGNGGPRATIPSSQAFPGDGTTLFGTAGNSPDSFVLRAGANEGYGLIETTPSASIAGEPIYRDDYADIRLEVDSELRLQVEVSYDDGNSYNTVFDVNLRDFGLAAPETLKFGFSAATGGANAVHSIDNIRVSAATDVAERMRLSAVGDGRAIIEGVSAASGPIHVDSGNTSAESLPLALFDATLDGLTLGGTYILTRAAAAAALRRIDFALEQIAGARVYLGAQVERYKFAREEATESLQQTAALSSILADTDVADGARSAALQSVLVGIGIFALAQLESSKLTQTDQLLDIIA